MLFSSISFLYYFLPITVLLYFAAPNRARTTVLLIASLIFYGWGEPRYLLLMTVTILYGYGFGLLLERHRTIPVLTLALAGPIGFLLFFKYADFLLGTLALPLLRIALPIGISFYTFQILSYLIDVYRGEAAVQKNLIRFAAYVTLFPQLIAGPIVRYQTIAAELSDRQSGWDDISCGIQRFLIGLGKKVLIANVLGEFCAHYRAAAAPSVLFAWLNAAAYTLQIYFDFSGYSDMAIGLGRVFGFHFMENFRYPFCSRSITEFWRRWHISLGSWFRDYVYIPLGGSRTSRFKWIRNILIVWALTGLWHGAAWNFVLWGLYFAALLLFEKLTKLKLPGIMSHIYVLVLVLLSFVLFSAEDLSQLVGDFTALFGFGNLPFTSVETFYYLRSFAIPLLIAMIGSTPLGASLAGRLHRRIPPVIQSGLRAIFLAAILLLCTAYLVDGSFNPFLYFRF